MEEDLVFPERSPLISPTLASQVAEALCDRGEATIRVPGPAPEGYRAGETPWQIRMLRLGDQEILVSTQGLEYEGHDPGRVRLAEVPLGADGFRPVGLVRYVDEEGLSEGVAEAVGWWGGDVPPDDVVSGPVVRELEVDPEDRIEEVDSLERFGRDLVEEARQGRLRRPLFRDDEIAALCRVISKQGQKSVCVTGPAGVGKTALVEGLAIAVAEGRVPPALADLRIRDVNLAAMAAGASHMNEFEGRLKQLLDRVRDDPDEVIFLDELHVIRKAGSDGADLVKSDLARGRVRFIGATTSREFRMIEEDDALSRRFREVPVEPLTPEQSRVALAELVPSLEAHHRVHIRQDLLQETIRLAERYAFGRVLPDSAIDLLDEACALASMAQSHPSTPDREGDSQNE